MVAPASLKKNPESITKKCPKCGAEATLVKNWVLRKRKDGTPVVIGLFKCKNGHTFRALLK